MANCYPDNLCETDRRLAGRWRLSFIRRARDLDFSIEQVRDRLALSDRRDQWCSQVDALAGAHLTDVEGKIAYVEALLSQCRKVTISTCLIIEAMGPVQAD